MADISSSQRIVPGAPPPPLLSKSQKKKRKSVTKPKVTDAPSAESILAIPDSKGNSVAEKIPEEPDVKKDAVAEAVEAPPLEPTPEAIQEKTKRASPAVELLNKRIKVQNKKLSRIAVYSSKPSSELNEDQRKSVATLPSIQGAVRELEETRKAIEALEAEEVKERAKQREEEEKASDDRVANAISDASIAHGQRLSEILSLLRLSSLLLASDPTTFALAIDEKERHALHVTADTLLASECPKKEEVISGLLFGQGDVEGIAYTRLLEVVSTYRNPPLEREPTPAPEEAMPHEDTEPPIIEEEVISSTVAVEPPPLAPEGVVPASSGGSFHFMQESELEGASFEHGAEWVEKPRDFVEPAVISPEVEAPAGLTVIDTEIPLDVNGVSKHADEPPLSAVSAALDWAADDGDGLPSINSLHAKFGTSGAATPEVSPQDASLHPEVSQAPEQRDSMNATPIDNGDTNLIKPHDSNARNNTQVDEDGFVIAKNSRGRQSDSRPDFRGSERGRGRGGFRGDRGGEYRGGYRGRGGTDSFGGGWRGGDGDFKGRGGYRGDRGRGGPGDFRGRGGRGGDFRGRGRGERGYRGGREGFNSNGDQGERQAQS